MIFKHQELADYLSAIKKKGKTEVFRDWKGDNVFLIRHDVDFDIKLAHDVAAIESKLDVTATFFILTTCHSYNVLSSQNRTLLQEMVGMGHEIGLHFDPTLYRDNLAEAVDKEAEVLAFACGQPIRSISLHNPSMHGQFPLFENYVNAHDPELFSDSNYISDSRFRFRNKDPYAFLDGIDKQMIQILLHPMHYSEGGDGYGQILLDTFERYMTDIHQGFYQNNTTYADEVGDSFLQYMKDKSS